MSKMSVTAKKRIAKCFVEKIFLPHQSIIQEGEKSKSLYIIIEGECIVYSTRNPLTYQ